VTKEEIKRLIDDFETKAKTASDKFEYLSSKTKDIGELTQMMAAATEEKVYGYCAERLGELL
jgi:hypothetical protein